MQILWAPDGASMPNLGAKALVDVTDGDTPNLRMPVRMLSVDTPEVTARSEDRAAAIDQNFKQLAAWMDEGRAPIDDALADHLKPRLETGHAGTLHFTQGKAASEFSKNNIMTRLTRPDGTRRNLFVRTADAPFDTNHRLLAYVAPDYSAAERRTMTREQRSTFNLDLVRAGWAAPFVIHPSIPGAADLALLIEAATEARTAARGIWESAETLLAYEYRSMERLFQITRTLVEGRDLTGSPRAWRERYCADMRTRELFGPEDYFRVTPEYRLWLWPDDLRNAIRDLNLLPTARLVGA
ncbi:thermonuclease family protein [Catenuloplanes atrovinosus]|uniref:Endonuclease YncB(Thermonuclease family) n=1 Tax=Catenuloplanes atrovinosus TaxID=137266 RepID=A0AAE3YLP3_9ACTN|nr:thermonuclease family protein [Catenuloplanes atrovinosus]MDR7274591.1 endonuclease YncB(thermonuclease family) [Catenuloplanes atrovinosus]